MLGGVFTPCTLTILGVIMFLRFGYVVGQAGIIYALAIIAVAKLITVYRCWLDDSVAVLHLGGPIDFIGVFLRRSDTRV